jgi:cold shock CspA family protein
LYISDESGARVQRWTVGEKQGITVAGEHGNGSGIKQLYHPLGIGFMDNALLVCDATNHRVQQWMLDGHGADDSPPSTICGGFGIGSAAGELGHCMDCFWDGSRLYVSDWYHACVRTYTREALRNHAKKAFEGQACTHCDGKRYTGVVTEWRDHGGYGFITDDLTGRRLMAHNSDIGNSLVHFGYAILTEGEHVEYCLLRDIVGKWKCDAVTAPGGGPVSPHQQASDMSINSGLRHSQSKRHGRGGHIDSTNAAHKEKQTRRWSRKDEIGKGKGRIWRPADSPVIGA